MPSVNVYDSNKNEVGTIELSDEIFGLNAKEKEMDADEVETRRNRLFYEAVRYQMAKRRAGTHATKSRSLVSGGGKKPFRQKGTGRARAGTTRAVHWRGGGVVHGPQPRSHALQMNKKTRKAALCAALARRCQENALTVFDAIDFPEIKTKHFVALMKNFEFDDLLLVTDGKDETLHRSSRNIPKVRVLPVDGLNVYDILNHRNLALTKGAVEAVSKRLG